MILVKERLRRLPKIASGGIAYATEAAQIVQAIRPLAIIQ